MTEPTIAAIYLRSAVSDDNAMAWQRSRCEAFSAARGWRISEIFSDNGTSGEQDRSGLQALRAHLQDGGARIVLADDVVRLARDPDLLDTFCRDCEQAGASIYTADGEFDMASPTLLAATADFLDRLRFDEQVTNARRQ